MKKLLPALALLFLSIGAKSQIAPAPHCFLLFTNETWSATLDPQPGWESGAGNNWQPAVYLADDIQPYFDRQFVLVGQNPDHAFGMTLPGVTGAVYLKKEFSIGSNIGNVYLNFSFRCRYEIYVNGVLVFSSDAHNSIRGYQGSIGAYLVAGNNLICVKASDAQNIGPVGWLQGEIYDIPPFTPSIQATANNFDCSSPPGGITLTAGTGGLSVWQWYQGSCGGTPVGSGPSITVSPSFTTTYFARGETGCMGVGDCGAITITGNSISTVNITANSSGTICAGTDVTFTATVPTGNNLSYQWKLNNADVGTNAAIYSNAALMNNDVVKCEVSNNCSTVTSNSVTMYVHTATSLAPTAVSTDEADNIICTGGSIALTANGTPLNGAIYKWYDGNCGYGTVVGTGQSIILSPSNGQHTYYAQLEESVCKFPCANVIVTVNPAITSVNVTSTATGTICAGTNITFTAAVTNAGIGVSYQWKLNDVNVGTNSLNYNNATLLDNDVVKCVVSNGCNTVTSNSLTMPVNLVPTSVTISMWNNLSTTICQGNYAAFAAVATNSGAHPTFIWKKNGVVVQTYANSFDNTSFYDSYNLNNNDVITCEMISQLACTLPVTSNGITMTVNPVNNPSVSIDITSGTNPDCSGGPLTFTATPTNEGTTPNYEWHLITGFPSSNTVVGVNSPTYTLQNPAHNDVLYCNMTSSIVCSNPAVASSNSVTVKAPSVLSGYINCNSNCNGTSVSTCGAATVEFSANSWNIINSVYYTNNSPSYQWKLNGTNIGTNSNIYTQTGFADGDVITCTVISTEPCSTPASLTLSMTVSVYDVSTASLSIYGPGSICSGTLATYYAQPINAGTNPTYEWKLERNNIVTVVGTDYYYESNAFMTGDIITCSIQTDAVCATPILIQSSNSVTINITPSVTPTITITASNPVSSLANVFTATVTNGGPNPTYYWRKNGLDVGFNSNTYLDMTLLNGDVITCNLESDAPCASTSVVTSNSITVAPLAYCIPNTIYGYSACDYAWITNVELGTINQLSVCGGFYTDFTLTDTVKTTGGQSISFTITEGTDGTDWGMNANIYVDYNRDGDFIDAGEKVADNIYMYPGNPASNSFTVPASLAPGSYRIRVMISNTNTSTSCDLDYGEAEDYILQITQADYCIPEISNPCDMWISNVTIGTINNTSVQPVNCGPGGYTDYSQLLSAIAAPGQTLDFSITGQSNLFFQQWQFADIYIDLNQDGDFEDTDERVVADFPFYAGYPYSGSFLIPIGQPYGYYRMRVKSYDYFEPQTGACGNNINGETEDYMLVVACVPNGSEIAIKGNDIDITDGDTSPDINDHTDFGNVELGTGFIRTFSIKNTGSNILTLGTVTLTGGINNNAFSIASQPLVNILNAGESTTFSVQFDSPVWGYGFNFSTTVHVASDQCDKKDYDFAIQATASCPLNSPDIGLQGNGVDIARFDFTPSINDDTQFGTVTANNTVSRTFTIQNNGNQPLEIYSIQLSNYDNAQQFSVTTQPAASIAAGSSTGFVITFNPAGSDIRYSYVRVLSNDCDESYYDFKVEGTSVCPASNPEIEISGNSNPIPDGTVSASSSTDTYFGVVPVGNSITRTFSIQNMGTDPLHISGIDFSGVNAAAFTVIAQPATTVAVGNSTSFGIRFSPQLAGIETAIVHIHNDDCDEGDYDFVLQGTDGSVCVPVIQVPCSDVYISNVILGNISNSSACSGGYTDYSTTHSTVAQAGQTVNFSVMNGGLYGQNVSIYADLNADGDFYDTDEELAGLVYSDGGTNASGTFVVPLSTATGSYRLRIVSEYAGYGSTDPCSNYNGEIEDYTLMIQSGNSITLDLKLFLQGYYTGNHTMQPVLNNQAVSLSLPNETDTITIELHEPATYSLVDTKQAVLLTDGTVSAVFAQPAGTYYIAVKHRNSIQTWSANPVDCPTQPPYDFSIAAGQAMGDNQVQVEPGVWAFFTGDLSQDDYIDGNDFPQYDSESASGGLYDGIYTPTDLNGDGFVDGNDFPVFDNNSSIGATSIHP